MGWRECFRLTAERERWRFADLARRTGIKQDTLQGWVQPKSKGQPSISQAIKLAEVMKLSLDAVFRCQIPDDEIDQIFARAADEVHALQRREPQDQDRGTG